MSLRQKQRRRLVLEALEDRSVPAGIYVEDFTTDTNINWPGFDTHRDGLRISTSADTTFGAKFIETPEGEDKLTGKHSLQLDPSLGGTWYAQYVGWTYRSNEAGGLAPWEYVRAVSVKVRGPVTVSFTGQTTITLNHTTPANEWETLKVTANDLDSFGQRLGHIEMIRIESRREALIDDVAVDVGTDTSSFEWESSVVRVRRFGDGLGIVGDRFNNAVRVELDYGQEGTIRVFGLGNTRILAGSANVIQVSEFEVLVPEFAHDQSFENGRPQLRERDLFIHLHDGDDRLQIAGGDTEARVVTVDDLFINMGKRQSIVEIDNLIVWDTVVFLSGSEQDELSLTGRTEMRALRVLTGGGNDDVRIGVPGAAVFEGVDPGRVQIGGFLESIDNGHGGTIAAPFLRMSLISTGSGNDNVWLAGGDFYDTVVVLGAGSDQFECTSARIWRGRLHDSNAEKVAFKECIVEGLRACWENTYLCV